MGRAEAQRMVAELVREKGLIRPRDLDAIGVSHGWITWMLSDRTLALHPPGVYSGKGRVYPSAVCALTRWPSTVAFGPTALYLHGLMPEPNPIWLALARSGRRPRARALPVTFLRCRGLPDDPDVESLEFDGARIRAFGVERSIIDCLRMLERMPPAAVREALRAALSRGLASRNSLRERARAKRCWSEVRAALDVFCEP